MRSLCTILVAAVLALNGCARVTTYGVGPYEALNAHDAETAYVRRTIVRLDGGPPFDKPAQFIKTPMPLYPDDMQNQRVQGRVLIRFMIEVDGRTSNFVIVESPHRELSQAAINAVRQWQFEPVYSGGTPIRAAFEIPFNFVLKS